MLRLGCYAAAGASNSIITAALGNPVTISNPSFQTGTVSAGVFTPTDWTPIKSLGAMSTADTSTSLWGNVGSNTGTQLALLWDYGAGVTRTLTGFTVGARYRLVVHAINRQWSSIPNTTLTATVGSLTVLNAVTVLSNPNVSGPVACVEEARYELSGEFRAAATSLTLTITNSLSNPVDPGSCFLGLVEIVPIANLPAGGSTRAAFGNAAVVAGYTGNLWQLRRSSTGDTADFNAALQVTGGRG